jgi:hypothetical protein
MMIGSPSKTTTSPGLISFANIGDVPEDLNE